MSDSDICRICGDRRDEHHAFAEPSRRPPGCVCEPGAWRHSLDALPPVCEVFAADPEVVAFMPTYCATCEHDLACHVDEPPPK